MEGEQWQKVKALFEAASHIAPDKRDRFLADACGGDRKLAREVKKLLVSLDEADTFLERPAIAEATSLFVNDLETIADERITSDLNDANLAVGSVLAGRYRILGLLGKGGMGEVYKAEDIKLSQTVALKFLPRRLAGDKSALNRFHAEVRMARQVSHPNVCRVFDIGEIDGRHFISMEYIHGDDLASMLKRIGRLASDKAVVIARQLCFGLAAIHDAGILHRDLKPANVIIDDHGKARITDFGIAGVEAELEGGEARIGTPAYMSPEQIKSSGVSQKSDIYSLGLLMYEVFTGKQTFEADSMIDLLVKQETAPPTNPSEVLKDIDPLVEKVILRCLEKDPEDRPANALQVAMMLPGGNPLEAAIAAGQTPSPEMVAAAPKKGALKPFAAVACLSALVAFLAVIILFAGKVKVHEWVPLEKSPEVLAERADSILKRIGHTTAPIDSDYGFDEHGNAYATYAAANNWEMIRTGQPAVYNFWHRTSPRYLEPLESEIVSLTDPPSDVSGMTRILLDTRGRLIEFQIVPAEVINTETPSGEVDWAEIFTEAGLDIRSYRPTESLWTPPFFADSTASWEGPHVDHADISVRIEAAAYQGKPVYFQVVAPWDKPLRQEELFAAAPRKAAGVILILVFLSVVVGAVLLARHNLKQGRSDTKGAFKISIFVLLVWLAASLIVADHIPDLGKEILILFKIAGTSLFLAALIGLLYLALEPSARRRWPSLIISWTRLLAGDWRDPLVGRDILIGGMLGLAHTVVIYSQFLIPNWIGLEPLPNLGTDVSYLQSFRHLVSNTLMVSVKGVFGAFAPLLFLILLVTIFKKQWLATAILGALYFLVLGLAFASIGRHWIVWFSPALIAAIVVVGISRFGLLTMIAFGLFFELSFHNAITGNISSWYFGNTVFTGAVLIGLAIYGFYTSLAGTAVFRGRFFRDA